jgi:hypothetical protein
VVKATYQSTLEAMHDDLQTAAGFSFPLIVAQTGSTPSAATAADMNAVRDAQLAAVDANADIYLGPVGFDRANLHWATNGEATTLSGRWFKAIEAALFGGTSDAPRLSSGSFSGDTITLTADQTLTTEASLTTSAWAVTDDDGARTVSAAASSGTDITLTVDQSLAAPVTVRLGSGDTGSSATVPESSAGGPMPAFTSGVEAEGTGAGGPILSGFILQG